MSSTSREVCELWDGERLNRVQHAGNIAIEEVIYLYGRGFETNRCLYTLDEAVERDFLVGQPAIRSLLKRMWLTWTGRWRTNSRSSLHYNIPPRSLTRRLTSSILPRTQPPYTRCDTSSEHEATNNGQRESPYSCPKACKSANLLGFTAPLAPNVILNTGIVLACPSILLGALLGIIVEAAVIIFLLVRSYIPWLFGLTQMAEESSRPLSAIGCILLSLGIFLICYIVDHSTQEIEYHINPERRKDISGFQVFWVQRGNQFEDQQYGSYLLLPQAKLDFILRSHPYEASGSNRTHVEHSDALVF
ncbi:hypothetical protein BDZ91DRAFT_455960 [Kalaharituber pfeilii]|nr:hypothetical protein BDZ91DRAFT_455960 [Kalaharituber pfeilii]